MPTSVPKHNLARVTAATPALVKNSGAIVYAIELYATGDAAANVKLFDTVNGSGTDTISVSCPLSESKFIDLEDLGGVKFSSKLFVTPTGTGAVAYVWYD